jgi:hypothetical protein
LPRAVRGHGSAFLALKICAGHPECASSEREGSQPLHPASAHTNPVIPSGVCEARNPFSLRGTPVCPELRRACALRFSSLPRWPNVVEGARPSFSEVGLFGPDATDPLLFTPLDIKSAVPSGVFEPRSASPLHGFCVMDPSRNGTSAPFSTEVRAPGVGPSGPTLISCNKPVGRPGLQRRTRSAAEELFFSRTPEAP